MRRLRSLYLLKLAHSHRPLSAGRAGAVQDDRAERRRKSIANNHLRAVLWCFITVVAAAGEKLISHVLVYVCVGGQTRSCLVASSSMNDFIKIRYSDALLGDEGTPECMASIELREANDNKRLRRANEGHLNNSERKYTQQQQ